MNSIAEVKEELIKLGFREISYTIIRNIHVGFTFKEYDRSTPYGGSSIQFLGRSDYYWSFMYKAETNEFKYWGDDEWKTIEEKIDIATMIALYK